MRRLGSRAILLLEGAILFAGAFHLALGSSPRLGNSPAQRQRPDVFLITIDTLRPDHVGCYGAQHVQTPNIDRLAYDSVRFALAVTPVPLTNPSHASILTGRYPLFHGVSDFGTPLNSALPTWAEILKQHAYSTAAFPGAAVLDSRTLAPGFNRGFDYYDDFDPTLPPSIHWNRVERRGAKVVSNTLSWLTKRRSTPSFVWMHLYDPHDPYDPPEPYATQYKSNPYDGEIAYADHALGIFLARLKELKIYESSLIVLLADHGEGLGDHHEMTHGIFLYDSTLRVPLLIKLPNNLYKGEVVSNLSRTIDVLPTVLELLSIDTTAQFDGVSLASEIKHNDLRTPRIALGETDYPLHFGWAPLESARSGEFKFIDAPRPELYDLAADPSETRNLYEPWNGAVQDLRAELSKYRSAGDRKSLPGLAPVSEQTIQELRALGYFPKVVGSTTVAEPSLLPDPKDKIEVQNLLHDAMVHRENNQKLQAEQALHAVLELEPGSGPALVELGELELQANNTRAAIDHLQHAARINPEDARVWFDIGDASDKLGDYEDAKNALDKSLKAAPENTKARLLLAHVDRQLGDLDGATNELEGAILIEPMNVEARIQLAEIYLLQNKYTSAAESLEQAKSVNASNREVYNLLAEAYAGLGDFGRAKAAKAQAAKIRH